MWQRRTSRRWQEDQRAAGRLRVLVENPSAALRFADFTTFREHGLDVALCSGPESEDDRCPLADGQPCPLAAAADVIVFGLDRDSVASRQVLDELRARHPGTPVAVEVARSRVGQPGVLPPGCVPLPFPSSIRAQMRAIRELGEEAS